MFDRNETERKCFLFIFIYSISDEVQLQKKYKYWSCRSWIINDVVKTTLFCLYYVTFWSILIENIKKSSRQVELNISIIWYKIFLRILAFVNT